MLESQILIASNRNIVCYDSSVGQGEFSTRLIKIMQDTMSQNSNNGSVLSVIHVPDSCVIPDNCEVETGVKIIKGVNNVMQVLNDDGGVLVQENKHPDFLHEHDDIFGVLGIGNNGDVLLGSY